MKLKSVLSFALCLVLALGVVGCTAQPAQSGSTASTEATAAPAADKTFVIGICQLVQHPALDLATQGFKDVLTEKLGDKVSFNLQNGSGDSATCATICNTFVSDEVDLILANATGALQAAQAATNKIPVLGTSVTDYGDALGIDSFTGKTGTNISGTCDRVTEAGQAEVLKELFPDAKKVGILYCSAEPNSKVQAAAYREVVEAMGYTVTDFTFADSNDLAAVAQTACDESDVIYIPTDNTAASNAELINNVALNAKTPILAGEASICKGCGVATLSISYYELGRKTGEMAVKILTEGTNPGDMDVQFADYGKLYNPSLCEALGIVIPEGYTDVFAE